VSAVRRLVVRLAVILGLATVSIVATAGSGSAYTPYYYGRPGGTGATTPRIQAYEYSSDFGQISFPARTASKSPAYANYTQKVCVTYGVVYSATTYATTWTPKSSVQWCGWLTSNNSIYVPGWSDNVYTFFIYAGNVRFDWYLQNGAWIGTTIQDFNYYGDYSCSNGCSIASTPSLGAYILW
jgi:hypothetical protein